MSDILEIVIEENDLELVFDASTELVFIDDNLEIIVEDEFEVIIDDEIIEILTDSEPGLPAGGTTGQILSKKSNTHFDAEWITNTKITVSTIAPTNPAIGDLWVDIN